jgi:hypothetical protein
LEILQTYEREQKPIQDVYAQITSLFNTVPDLVEGFKQFLPDPDASNNKGGLDRAEDHLGLGSLAQSTRHIASDDYNSATQSETVEESYQNDSKSIDYKSVYGKAVHRPSKIPTLASPADVNKKSSAQPNSPGSAKKASMIPSKESTIYVESKQRERREEPPSMIVKLKYSKRRSKTISRLLALDPRKKTDTVKNPISLYVLDSVTPPEPGEPATAQSLHHDQNSMAVPPTDSGYASVRNTIDGKRQIVEQSATHDLQDTSVLQCDDAATEYSDALSVETSKRESYISDFADDLFRKVSDLQPDEQDFERIFAVLPDLLKAFALRLGYNAPMPMHRDVMYFVHKYRK